MTRSDVWADDPAHPVEDWKSEVANDDTRLGYLAWVETRTEMLGAIGTSQPATAIASKCRDADTVTRACLSVANPSLPPASPA